ncbi:MAG: HPr family phosphocarrier protein [Abditibacteriota bacterium]|nr:HPr family phosphocarrier protein [Abditibacteriota bacterium]
MTKFEYVIKDALGFHVRPAGLFVKEMKKFASEITVSCGDKSVTGPRLIALMGMGVKGGDTVCVACSGDDEAEAADCLKAFLENNL